MLRSGSPICVSGLASWAHTLGSLCRLLARPPPRVERNPALAYRPVCSVCPRVRREPWRASVFYLEATPPAAEVTQWLAHLRVGSGFMGTTPRRTHTSMPSSGASCSQSLPRSHLEHHGRSDVVAALHAAHPTLTHMCTLFPVVHSRQIGNEHSRSWYLLHGLPTIPPSASSPLALPSPLPPPALPSTRCGSRSGALVAVPRVC
jgi:hypothetical protein